MRFSFASVALAAFSIGSRVADHSVNAEASLTSTSSKKMLYVPSQLPSCKDALSRSTPLSYICQRFVLARLLLRGPTCRGVPLGSQRLGVLLPYYHQQEWNVSNRSWSIREGHQSFHRRGTEAQGPVTLFDRRMGW